MIPENPNTDGVYGTFRYPEGSTEFHVVRSPKRGVAFVCANSEYGPIAAQFTGLHTNHHRIEFGDHWRDNDADWRHGLESTALRVIQGSSPDRTYRQCEG